MNTNFIQSILAGFLDKFKAKSPLIFVILASVLTGAKFFLESGQAPLDPGIIDKVLWFFALVLNSGTFNFKDNNQG